MTRWVAFVSVGANQRILLLVLAQNPHKGLECEISHETGRDEGRKVPERAEEISQQNRRVKRRKWEVGPVDTEAWLANMR